MAGTLSLHWTLARSPSGDALVVQYRMQNNGAASVNVLDQMIALGATQGYDLAPEALIVRADKSDPTLVHLIRGRVDPYGRPKQEVPAGMRALAPGAEITGSARAPLPLQSWHPNDGYRKLASAPQRAVLEIGVLSAEAETQEWPLNKGSQLVPAWADARSDEEWVKGEVQAIP